MPLGIIVKGIGGFYYVKTEEGVFECKARGIFRKEEKAPLPGDRVMVSVIDTEKKLGSLDEILPRDSQLIRPAVANVNQLAAVISVRSPAPDLFLLDKLLLTAEQKKLEVVLCINKVDLDESQEYQKWCMAYEKAGYKTIFLSSKLDLGFEELRSELAQKVTVFAGQSGVGKSTILNKIMSSWVMETGNVSSKIERGKHTTRHAELVELDSGGYIVDTPGFSSFELAGIPAEKLELYYPEFSEHLYQCKFTGCSHISEPGCAIKDALSRNFIDEGRYQRYIHFYTLLKQQKDYHQKDYKKKGVSK